MLVNATLLVSTLALLIWKLSPLVAGETFGQRLQGGLLLGGALVAATLAIYLLSGALSSPFWDRMTEQLERFQTGRLPDHGATWFRALWRSATHTLLSLALWIAFQVVLLPLQLVPGFGSLLATLLGFGGTALFMARELLDPALSRRRYSYRAKWGEVWRHKGELFWLGGAVSLGVLIPFLNFVVVPWGLAAGTLWWLAREDD